MKCHIFTLLLLSEALVPRLAHARPLLVEPTHSELSAERATEHRHEAPLEKRQAILGKVVFDSALFTLAGAGAESLSGLEKNTAKSALISL